MLHINRFLYAIILCCAVLLPACPCFAHPPQNYYIIQGEPLRTYSIGEKINGVACWYGGRKWDIRTPGKEHLVTSGLTAAHRQLPYGTIVRITRLQTGKSINVTVNDRGPTSPRYCIDLSKLAAQQLGFIRAGITNVRMEILSLPAWYIKEHRHAAEYKKHNAREAKKSHITASKKKRGHKAGIHKSKSRSQKAKVHKAQTRQKKHTAHKTRSKKHAPQK